MSTDAAETHAFDLDAYFKRIDYAGSREPTAGVLQDVHLAHATHIPYENLDILLGRPIRLDLPSIQAKIVHGGRGGYCFEQNTLLTAALRKLGFPLQMLAGRVLYRYSYVMPRTHMILVVEADGKEWLADVGFGSLGLLLPIPLAAGIEVRQHAWEFRLLEQDGLWLVQSRQRGEWVDLYAFTREPQHMADYEMANYYTSTHPDSRFVQTLTAQRMTTEMRCIIRDRELITDRGDQVSRREIADGELLSLLAETFGLHFPEGTRFQVPGGSKISRSV